ncbi:MAG: DUF1491 family protein [Alphaproteobacteria bacterium]|nr:DUF1491 family protein [Alphaproteobacteria bacterium]
MVRLKSSIYVQALIRRCEAAGAAAYLVRHGAEEAGAIFLKIDRLDGTCMVLSQARRGEEAVWLTPLGEASDEQHAAEYFAKQLRIDPDIWIVEIEDRQGRSFVTEPVV